MNRYWCVVTLAAMLAGGCGPRVSLEQERAALMARDRDWAESTKDTDRFVSYFAADATVYAPGTPAIKGVDAIRRMHADMSAAPGFTLTWTVENVQIAASGDLGYSTGTYTSAMGGPPEIGKYVTVWKKEGTEWKVAEEIFNADTDGPPIEHEMVPVSMLVWGDAPPGLPAGAKVAVVAGDPGQSGPFVMRAMVPAGFTVPAHWHPAAENLTVLTGIVEIGMGDSPQSAVMTTLNAGGFVVLPADMRHIFVAKTDATIQVHGEGPFEITYVNPADDPRGKR